MCLGSRVGSRGSEVWGTRRAGKPRRMAQGWAGFSEEELRRLKQTKGKGTGLQSFNSSIC